MGQPIQVEPIRLGEVVIFTTDRSLGGQDGEVFEAAGQARQGETWPARLAVRLWDVDPSISSVYVLSNTISVRRPDWTEADVERAAAVIRNLFVFYEENRAAAT